MPSRSSGSFGVPYPAAEPSGFFEDPSMCVAERIGVVPYLGREAAGPERDRTRHCLLHVGVARQGDLALFHGQRLERLGDATRVLGQ